jgi:pimeloyl-ACP methyl ester carboxylesterase
MRFSILRRGCATLGLVVGLGVAGCENPGATPKLPPGAHGVTSTAGGVTLHYVVSGSGPTLALIHGWPESSYMWRKLTPPLQDKYTVVAIDLPGFGESPPLASDTYDKKSVADAVHGVLQKDGYSQMAIVGHDIGAMVAFAYAAAYPAEVSRLVLIEAGPPTEAFYQFPAFGQGAPWWFGLHGQDDLAVELVTGHESTYLRWFFDHLTTNRAAISDADIDVYANAAKADGALRAGFRYYGSFAQDIEADKAYESAKLSLPILSIGGANFAGMAVATLTSTVASDVQPLVVADSGHWVPEEQPETLAPAILDFLSH